MSRPHAPLAAPAAETAGAAGDATGSGGSGGAVRPRVLLIEPDDSTRWVYETVFQAGGYGVEAVPDVRHAESAFRARPHDVVVTADPRPERHAWIGDREGPEPPLVLVADPDRPDAAGFDAVLVKPVTPHDLLESVAICLDHDAAGAR